jgi:hypothetical protein
MPIYLCHEGHKHRSQEAATNCGYCKRNHRTLVEGPHRTNIKNQRSSAAPIKPPDGPKSNFYPLMLEFRHIGTQQVCKKINATDNLSGNEVDVLRQHIEDEYESLARQLKAFRNVNSGTK